MTYFKRRFIGEHGNAWDNELVNELEFSNPVDTKNLPHISIFGQVQTDTTIYIYLSADGENWFVSPEIIIEPDPALKPPQWQKDTLYYEDTLVFDEGEIYQALETHTSTNQNRPPSDKWQLYEEENDLPKTFHFHSSGATRFIKLRSSDETIITATICAKP